MTSTAKRAALQCLVEEHMLSRVKACKIVGFSRSALYKPLVNWANRDSPVIDALNAVVAKRPRWGFWKCFHRLRNDDHDLEALDASQEGIKHSDFTEALNKNVTR